MKTGGRGAPRGRGEARGTHLSVDLDPVLEGLDGDSEVPAAAHRVRGASSLAPRGPREGGHPRTRARISARVVDDGALTPPPNASARLSRTSPRLLRVVPSVRTTSPRARDGVRAGAPRACARGYPPRSPAPPGDPPVKMTKSDARRQISPSQSSRDGSSARADRSTGSDDPSNVSHPRSLATNAVSSDVSASLDARETPAARAPAGTSRRAASRRRGRPRAPRRESLAARARRRTRGRPSPRALPGSGPRRRVSSDRPVDIVPPSERWPTRGRHPRRAPPSRPRSRPTTPPRPHPATPR